MFPGACVGLSWLVPPPSYICGPELVILQRDKKINKDDKIFIE